MPLDTNSLSDLFSPILYQQSLTHFFLFPNANIDNSMLCRHCSLGLVGSAVHQNAQVVVGGGAKGEAIRSSLIAFSWVGERGQTDGDRRSINNNKPYNHVFALYGVIQHVALKPRRHIFTSLLLSLLTSLSLPVPVFLFSLWHFCEHCTAPLLDHGSGYISWRSMSKAVMSSGVHPARRCRTNWRPGWRWRGRGNRDVAQSGRKTLNWSSEISMQTMSMILGP